MLFDFQVIRISLHPYTNVSYILALSIVRADDGPYSKVYDQHGSIVQNANNIRKLKAYSTSSQATVALLKFFFATAL